MLFSLPEFKVEIFGSSFLGLACNGSDMDMTILFDSYLAENAEKQVHAPKIAVRALSGGTKQQQQKEMTSMASANGSNNSDSNLTEAIEEHIDIDEDEGDLNSSDKTTTLKQSIAKFFVNKSLFSISLFI